MSLWRSNGNLHMLNSSAGNYMWSLKSLAFPPEIVLEDMEVTWIVLGIKLFQTYVPPSPWRFYGERFDQGIWSGRILLFSAVRGKGTKESCHARPIGGGEILLILLESSNTIVLLFIYKTQLYLCILWKNILCPQKIVWKTFFEMI